MKFSDIDQERWPELKPYMDTCLLPVTGLTGREEPWEVTAALERLRDVMEDIEKRYVGRIVTYPAFHYTKEEQLPKQISELCVSLRESGFAYVIVITADPLIGMMERPEGADLFLNGLHVQSGQAVRMIGNLWQPKESLSKSE